MGASQRTPPRHIPTSIHNERIALQFHEEPTVDHWMAISSNVCLKERTRNKQVFIILELADRTHNDSLFGDPCLLSPWFF